MRFASGWTRGNQREARLELQERRLQEAVGSRGNRDRQYQSANRLKDAASNPIASEWYSLSKHLQHQQQHKEVPDIQSVGNLAEINSGSGDQPIFVHLYSQDRDKDGDASEGDGRISEEQGR